MSNRNIADLFEDSASRTLEDNSGVTYTKNINVNETITKQKQNNNKIETKQIINNLIENDDVLGFLNTNKKKTLVGFHLEDDINRVIKKVLGNNPGKGAQSELANRIFRDFFEKRGLL
ncbi:hypothetical protein [Bacillus thuringiensis]|uniref:hypothetical protein n=1 Tax=Bacillus thuringiensis TaxID=1428 RepID=UPI003B982BDF